MKHGLLAVAVIALASVLAGAQKDELSGSIQLRDISPPDAPLKFAGSVNYDEWAEGDSLRVRMKGTASGINVSRRPIVAWIAKAVVTGTHDGPHGSFAVADHFFKDHPAPETMFTFEVSDNEKSTVQELGVIKNPRELLNHPLKESFTAETVFVQFEDGTTWGDPQAGAELLKDREEGIAFLERLRGLTDAYAISGILDGKGLSPRAKKLADQLRNLQKTSGTDAVVDKVNSALQAAANRKMRGNF